MWSNELKVVALYDFEGGKDGDLTFYKGDIIIVLNRHDSGWCYGEALDGRQGIFPANYVEFPPEVSSQLSPGISQPVYDRIDKVVILPEENLDISVGQQYMVRIHISQKGIIEERKTMKHFRVLNHALNSVCNTNTGIGRFGKQISNENQELQEEEEEEEEEFIPEWADDDYARIPDICHSSYVIERARILTSFMTLSSGEPKTDCLISLWCNPNFQFSFDSAQKSILTGVLANSQKQIRNHESSRLLPSLMVKAMYSWHGTNRTELSFIKGEVFAADKSTQYLGWWKGTKYNGEVGLFPSNYVKEISPSEREFYLNLKITKNKNKSEKSTLIFKTEDERPRRHEQKYSLCCTEAFDELMTEGFTIEENRQWRSLKSLTRHQQGSPKKNDIVTLQYSGYIWLPQRQGLVEFVSDDKFQDKLQDSNQESGPLVFTVGADEAIDGIDRAVRFMRIGQSFRVTISPEFAYGDPGYPPDIPGRAFLVYDLTLVKVENKDATIVPRLNGAAKSTVFSKNMIQKPHFLGNNSLSQMAVALQQKSRRGKTNPYEQPNPSGRKLIDTRTFKKKLDLKKLQEIVAQNKMAQYGIDPTITEEYLTVEEFEATFQVDYLTWLLMPSGVRNQLKQKFGLLP